MSLVGSVLLSVASPFGVFGRQCFLFIALFLGVLCRLRFVSVAPPLSVNSRQHFLSVALLFWYHW